MRKVFLLFAIYCLLFPSTSVLFAINLKIRIYSDKKINTLALKSVSGTYKIIDLTNNKKIYFNNKEELTVTIENNKLRLSIKDTNFDLFDSLKIKGTGLKNSIRLVLSSPKEDELGMKLPKAERQGMNSERIYDDDIIIKINPKLQTPDAKLFIINDVEIEHYTAGVVEMESGSKANFISAKGKEQQVNSEYYKVQAIICRTYALKNFRKHIKEGYNLCDMVHCQVYKGRCNNPDIILAVSKTSGDVIVDKDNQLINAAFHANCGGQTLNSEDVWARSATYLKTINDTFCLNMSKARWEKTIAKKDFLNYLQRNNIKDSIIADSLMNFRQEKRKSVFYDTIKVKHIRDYFGLKSSYFTIYPKGDSLVFKGRGNGHGIGLCQEGAMNMANYGYNYKKIIKYYYKNVEIVNYNKNKTVKLL